MQKNIFRLVVILILLSGVYGCSCSQSPTAKAALSPGLYVESTARFLEGAMTPTVNITLVRAGNTSDVTVNYEILASTSTTDPLATMSGDTADLSDVSGIKSLTFDGTTADKLSIPLTIVDDDLYELDEVFVIKLTSSVGANIIKNQVEVTIINDDKAPIASITLVGGDTTASLSEASVRKVDWTVSLSEISGVDASMKISRSVEFPNRAGQIAAYRIDYLLFQNDVILPENAILIIPAGELTANFSLEVIDDGIKENQETFSLTLSKREHVTMTAESSFAFTIDDDDAPKDDEGNEVIVAMKLNDTGVVDLPELAGMTDSMNAQADKSVGFDSQIESTVKTGGGRGSFDFSKVASDGTTMPSDSVFETDPWDCVRDNITGLLWEVKKRGAEDARGEGRRFYWHDPSYATNGGNAGVKGLYFCGNEKTTSSCNTAYYAADMNQIKLCGKTGWRLPSLEELRSIVDYNRIEVEQSGPVLIAFPEGLPHYDLDYFAGDQRGIRYMWTSTTDANNAELAWTIKFDNLVEESRYKNIDTSTGIRLVNDSEIRN